MKFLILLTYCYNTFLLLPKQKSNSIQQKKR